MESTPASPTPQATAAAATIATTTAAAAGGSSEQHPADRCRYAGKRCFNPRATKRNGEHHSLCHAHRVRANQNQRRMELKRRLSRNREDNARATARSHAHPHAYPYASAHSRAAAAAMYSAFRIAASTGSISAAAYSPSPSYSSPSYSSPSSPLAPSLQSVYSFSPSSPSSPFSANTVTLGSIDDIDAHLGWDVSSAVSVHEQLQHHLQAQLHHPHYYLHRRQLQLQHRHTHHTHHFNHQYLHTPTSRFPSLSSAAPADYTLEAIVEPVLLDDGSYSFADLSCNAELAKDDEIARTVLELADAHSLQHDEFPLDSLQHSQSDDMMWVVPNFLLTL